MQRLSLDVMLSAFPFGSEVQTQMSVDPTGKLYTPSTIEVDVCPAFKADPKETGV